MLECFLSDIHFPFHDPAAWGLALKVVKKLRPELIWLGGDIVDFYAVSRYDKSPERKLRLQEELDVAHRELRRLRKSAPQARIVYQIGNHEERLTKYLWGKAPELASLRALSLPALLGFERLNIELITDHRPQPIGQLYHLHGHLGPGGSVNAARGKANKFKDNVIFGHHHRHQVEYQRAYSGRTIGAWANGCLCGMEPEFDPCPQWTHGITVVRHARDGAFHVDQLVFFPTRDRRGLAVVVEGRLEEFRP
jgi:predicted phosphodiesterase